MSSSFPCRRAVHLRGLAIIGLVVANALGLVVLPVEGRIGGDCAVGLHDVGGCLCIAFYLHAYLFIAVPLAASAVPVLADTGLRCDPRLRFASLHAEGDSGYLQGVLSFGQSGIVRQLVLRAGCR